MKINHILEKQLYQVGILYNPERVQIFNRGVRDSSTITAFRHMDSGVIYLNRLDPQIGAYKNRPSIEESAKSPDVLRRASFLKPYVEGRVWCDVGSGGGGLVYALQRFAEEVVVVESDTDFTSRYSCKVLNSTEKLSPNSCNVITLMHVIEHMEDPIGELGCIRSALTDNGYLFIETPNAADRLMLSCSEFRKHSLWSHHFVLYTAQALHKLLDYCEFSNSKVTQLQRYPRDNHVAWYSNTRPRPGPVITHPDIKFVNELKKHGQCDTLWVTIRK